MLLIEKYSIVCNFTSFSDHAPLHVRLRCILHDSQEPERNSGTSSNSYDSYRWKEELKDQCYESLTLNSGSLSQIVFSDIEKSQDGIDNYVESFTSNLMDIISPFFCNSHNSNNTCDRTRSKTTRYKDDKPWFNYECKRLRSIYISSLYTFNRDKNVENHQILIMSKRQYKRLENKLKRKYKRQEGDMIATLRKSDPKKYYKLFQKKRAKNSDVSLSEFFEHFRNLVTNDGINVTVDTLESVSDATYDELDQIITQDEILKCISNLKRGKSHGIDGTFNELFIEFKDILLPFLEEIFNKILASGHFPKSWALAVLIPVFKKGDSSDPANYRGISLVSNLAKLFTSIINSRLIKWSENNDIITDAQFGFRPGSSTVDAIYSLLTLVQKALFKKKRLYCCFVDYKQAFDSVTRLNLWLKLSRVGITGKLLSVLKSMYSTVKVCVKVDGFYSEQFTSSVGLMQGEVLSPILFSLYVNDFEMEFLRNSNIPYEVQDLSLFLLMYADDMILFSDSVIGLQDMLDTLLLYTCKWGLTVNIAKTKIMVFRNGGFVKDEEIWYYDGNAIDIVDEFCYLGVLLNFNGKFVKAQKHLAEQSRKAVFGLKSKVSSLYLNVFTYLNLFDTYISSILCYGCEIWGFHKAPNIEKIQLDFCKNILGVKQCTTNVMVYFELGRYPLIYFRMYKIVKYWLKLLSTSNCILKNCYREQLYNFCNIRSSWIYQLQQLLFNLGLNEIWYNQDNLIIDTNLLLFVKTRIYDQAKQTLNDQLNVSSKCYLYKYIVNNVCLQNYLTKHMNFRVYLTRLRLSSHNLFVEVGRYHGVNRLDRKCTLCTLNITEDEFHFVLQCESYRDLRRQFIKPYYYRRPSSFKLVQLLSTENVKDLRNLCKFLFNALNHRTELLLVNT